MTCQVRIRLQVAEIVAGSQRAAQFSPCTKPAPLAWFQLISKNRQLVVFLKAQDSPPPSEFLSRLSWIRQRIQGHVQDPTWFCPGVVFWHFISIEMFWVPGASTLHQPFFALVNWLTKGTLKHSLHSDCQGHR